ncbi:MAG TPA: hypothetical protein VK670_16660, partial [Silvibacterium sp.]|nr:hypothetical protein [Silvibacterium sp.]
LDLKIPIEELRPDSNMFSFAPQFYVRRTIVGEKQRLPAIEFGLVTQESLKKSFHPADDKAKIPIACLPSGDTQNRPMRDTSKPANGNRTGH